MHFSGFDLNLLVALDALLTERNVSRAADRLHLSQSAMSGALARMRERMGDQLLIRDGRQLILTHRAEERAPRVRTILREARDIIRPEPTFNPEVSDRRFTIAISD